MTEHIDMMSDEWLDEFEKNWGIAPFKDQAANTGTEHQRKSSTGATGSDQKEHQS